MASDSSSGFRRDITHFITATQNTTKSVEGRTNELYGLGSVPSTRKGSLCDDFVQLFVHLQTIMGVYFVRDFYKATRNSNLSLTVIPRCLLLLTVLPPDCYLNPTVLLCSPLSTALSLGSFVNWPFLFSRTFLFSSTSGLAEDLVFSPLCGFRAKAEKEILWPAHIHTQHNEWLHSVTVLILLFSFGVV